VGEVYVEVIVPGVEVRPGYFSGLKVGGERAEEPEETLVSDLLED
jgi:hypothetical protein